MKSFAISIALTLSADAALANSMDDHFESDALLPAYVLAGIEELATYGDRFELAIEMIRKEALKPFWGFDTCGVGVPMVGS